MRSFRRRNTAGPAWNSDSTELTFCLESKTHPYFFHRFNAGWPPHRCTERIVELALADDWLQHRDSRKVVEIGAVTPWYWPRRVETIIDPADPHHLVTRRESVFDVDLQGAQVLSISTFEHIGTGDYSLAADEQHTAVHALEKLFREAADFLVTLPAGWNPAVDDYVFSGRAETDRVHWYFLIRTGPWQWVQETDRMAARRSYGNPDWADALIIAERGGHWE